MELVVTGLLFMLGAGVGSFIATSVFRISKKTYKKSRCDKCAHKLIWSDLVPILSYIVLKGKCRYCKKKIDKKYILIEVLMGCLFALSYLQLLFSWGQLVVWLCILGLMVTMFLTDLYYQKLRLSQILVLTIFCLIFTILTEIIIEQKSYSIVLYEHLFSLLPLTVLFSLVYLFSKGKLIGLGDILISIPLVILLPWQESLNVLLIASILGVLFYLPQAINRKISSSIKVPFGSFLILATIIVIFTMKFFVNFF